MEVEDLSTILDSANLQSHCGNQCGGSLKSRNKTSPYYSAILLLGILDSKDFMSCYSVVCRSTFIVRLLTLTGKLNQPTCPSTNELVMKMQHTGTKTQ